MKYADIFLKKPPTLRIIEEQCFGCYNGLLIQRLKETLSNLQNFLLFFKQENYLKIFKYWGLLLKNNCDPVQELNKSLELFELHHKPIPKDLFIIVAQLSRFFMGLSEIEPDDLPEFRHPKIMNLIITKVGRDVKTVYDQNQN